MSRISKRFILHNNREEEKIIESDLDDIKQSVQSVRYELMNDLSLFNDNLKRYSRLLHTGLSLIGEYFVNEYQTDDVDIKRFEKFRSHDSAQNKEDSVSSINIWHRNPSTSSQSQSFIYRN